MATLPDVWPSELRLTDAGRRPGISNWFDQNWPCPSSTGNRLQPQANRAAPAIPVQPTV